MRARFLTISGVATLWVLAGVKVTLAQDIKKAHQEGVVVWYTNLNVDASQGIAKTFEKKNPCLKVRLYRAGNSARSDVEPNPPRLLRGLSVWVPDPQDDINKIVALYNEAFGLGRK